MSVERTNLTVPLSRAAGILSENFKLGAVLDFKTLSGGYQDLNVKLETENGAYVAKFFSKERSLKRVQDIVKAVTFFRNAGLPVLRLRSLADSGCVYAFQSPAGTTWAVVYDFFDGQDFSERLPGSDDVAKLSRTLAEMHKSSIQAGLEIERFYDDWGACNVHHELEKHSNYLDHETQVVIENIIKLKNAIQIDDLPRCTIHGDIYRSHVLKDNEDNFCIIDFGCIDYRWAALDLGIFLAWFCLPGLSDAPLIRESFDLAVDNYCSVRQLTPAEKMSLPYFVLSSYAAYCIATTRLIARGDDSHLTAEWNRRSKDGIAKCDIILGLS